MNKAIQFILFGHSPVTAKSVSCLASLVPANHALSASTLSALGNTTLSCPQKLTRISSLGCCIVACSIDNSRNSRAGFPKLWVATQKWVAKFCQVGRQSFLEIFIFSHLFVNWMKILFSSYHCSRSSPLSCQRA